jgi:hypothetical protein
MRAPEDDDAVAEAFAALDARTETYAGPIGRRATQPTKPEPSADETHDDRERGDAGDDHRPRRSQATRLIDLVMAEDAELWHTPAGDAHISFPNGGHTEHHRLNSRAVRDRMAHLHHRALSTAPGSQAISDALSVLAGMARYEGEAHDVAVRVAGRPGAVYLDLCDADWRAIEITATGWRLSAAPPVRFTRARGMLPLTVPTGGGSLDALRGLLSIRSDDDSRLMVGWLVGALRSEGPYPPLALLGEQGSAKSTTTRILRRLIDPHVAELRAEPRAVDDIMIAATRSWIVAFDNLSTLPGWLSDALCRLSTGGALTKRELYSDADETILEAMRPVMMSSITDIITRGDLLDRAIVVTLPVLPERDRLPEAELWRRFADLAPSILGALCDAVVSALARQASVQLDSLPRMADWAVWTAAAAPACGWDERAILDAYLRMKGSAIETTLDGDPLAVRLRALSLPWTGTTTELLARLTPEGRQPRGWPESPRALSAALRRLAPGLRRVGIEMDHHRAPGTGNRLVTLEQTRAQSSRPSHRHDPAPIGGNTVTQPVTVMTERRPHRHGDRHAHLPMNPGLCDDRDGCDGAAPLSPSAEVAHADDVL